MPDLLLLSYIKRETFKCANICVSLAYRSAVVAGDGDKRVIVGGNGICRGIDEMRDTEVLDEMNEGKDEFECGMGSLAVLQRPRQVTTAALCV